MCAVSEQKLLEDASSVQLGVRHLTGRHKVI